MSGETHFDFTANRNGHDSPAPGNLGFNQIELHRIDKRQAEVKAEKGWNPCGDGSRKTFEGWKRAHYHDRNRGQADRITVWTRTGGTKSANDLFAGEWTQDLSKTRLRQGLVLKIEADGSGGDPVFWVTSAIPPVLMESNTI